MMQAFAAMLAAVFSLMATQIQAASLGRVGTLTCTTSDAAPQVAADAKLSCRFHNVKGGRGGGFTGTIARKGEADLPPGKRVLVWSVLAAKSDLELSALAGKYVGETGGQVTGRLRGGENNTIILQPVTVTSQVGDEPVPSILELRLDPVKT
jgi:hypothetical protein